MRIFLTRLMATIKNKPRYIPEIIWSDESLIHNFFRALEWLFGRETGIRKESASSVHFENGIRIETLELYTLEAILSYIEVLIRDFFTIKFLPFKLVAFKLSKAKQPQGKELGIPWIMFAIALDVADQGTVTATSPITGTHTCTGSNGFLTVSGACSATTPTISTPTYNSVSMTICGSTETNSTDIIGLWFLGGPSTGSNTISMGFGGTSPHACYVAVSYTGCQSGSTADASAGNTGAASPTVTVTTVAANCWVAAACVSTASLASPNRTRRTSGLIILTGTNKYDHQDTNGSVAAGTGEVMSWSTGTNWSEVAGSFAPAAAGGVQYYSFLSSTGIG